MHMESADNAAPFRPPHPMSSAIGGGEATSHRCNDDGQGPAHFAALAAENRELRAEIERLRCERARMNDVQTRIMELLGTKSPERILHDLRNVLNERELYRALADATM